MKCDSLTGEKLTGLPVRFACYKTQESTRIYRKMEIIISDKTYNLPAVAADASEKAKLFYQELNTQFSERIEETSSEDEEINSWIILSLDRCQEEGPEEDEESNILGSWIEQFNKSALAELYDVHQSDNACVDGVWYWELNITLKEE